METRQENKRATIYGVLFIMTVVLLVITGYVGYQQYERNEELVTKFNQEELKLKNEFSDEFRKIELNLSEISAHELVLRNSIRNPQTEVPFEQSKRIENEILLIQSLLDQNNAMIEQLQKDLGTSDEKLIAYQKRISGLEQKIVQYKQDLEAYLLENEELKVNLAQTEKEKNDLNTTVIDQNTQLADQEITLTSQNAKIAEMDLEKNTVYFIVGREEELEESGIVVNDGSFLGIGMGQKMSLPADKTKFTCVDKREYTMIPVYSKKVTLITEHDPSSYELVTSSDIIKWIKITDVDKFWDGSDYLVVATKEGVDLGIAHRDLNRFNHK